MYMAKIFTRVYMYIPELRWPFTEPLVNHLLEGLSLPRKWFIEKDKVGNGQEKSKSEGNSHSKNRGGKILIDNKVFMLMEHIVSRVCSYFPIGGSQLPELNI